MADQTKLHRWCDTQAFVDPTEVIVGNQEGNRRLMVLQLLAMGIRPARVTP